MSCGSTTCTSKAFIRPNHSLRASRAWFVPNPLSGFIQLARMQERWRQRQQLLELDDRLLDDIGLTREDAIRQASRPFWR